MEPVVEALLASDERLHKVREAGARLYMQMSAVDWGPIGRRRTNEWVTVRALAVLRAAGKLGAWRYVVATDDPELLLRVHHALTRRTSVTPGGWPVAEYLPAVLADPRRAEAADQERSPEPRRREGEPSGRNVHCAWAGSERGRGRVEVVPG